MSTDRIIAVADGRVAHINRISGNSNYGKYIVLVHDDAVGEMYTLYAHLADVDQGLKAGQAVARGDEMGLMGNSASTGIPVERGHLHFEIGMINNQKFNTWFRHQKLKPDHGNYHGHNLTGINPYDLFATHERLGYFNMADYLRELEPAFTVAVRAGRKPDYFHRYPGLWTGADSFSALVMTVSEGGVPLSGRPATEEERKLLGSRATAVVDVNEARLGRNGLRLVTRKQGAWVLGKNGVRWLEILTYH
jgi:hypothetical protein